jgi:hypothetical protein
VILCARNVVTDLRSTWKCSRKRETKNWNKYSIVKYAVILWWYTAMKDDIRLCLQRRSSKRNRHFFNVIVTFRFCHNEELHNLCSSCFYEKGLMPCPNSELTSWTTNHFRHLVGLLGWGIGPSKGLYLHRTVQHEKNMYTHPCLEWDLNSLPQCSKAPSPYTLQSKALCVGASCSHHVLSYQRDYVMKNEQPALGQETARSLLSLSFPVHFT